MNAAPEQVIVMPVYEDVDAASHLFKEIAASLGQDIFIVAVDDGSVHRPLPAEPIAVAGLDGVVIRLTRNVGHQRAIAVGLGYVADHFPNARCVVMDSDGEDLPASVPRLIAPLAREDVDVVVAQRKRRVETFRFKLFYFFYKIMFGMLTGRAISFGNFMALKPRAVRRLTAMSELGVHVAGTVILSKLRVVLEPLDRGPRYAGRSNMNFSGLLLHGFRALMVFAEDVKVRIGVMCVGISLLSLFGMALATLLKLMGFATPGWFSMVLGILVLTLLQTGTLTLMTLMMTGVMRGALAPPDYRALVDEVLTPHGRAPAPAP